LKVRNGQEAEPLAEIALLSAEAKQLSRVLSCSLGSHAHAESMFPALCLCSDTESPDLLTYGAFVCSATRPG